MAYKIQLRASDRLKKLVSNAPVFALQRTARDCLRAAKRKIGEIYTVRKDVIGRYLSTSSVDKENLVVYLVGSRKEKRGNIQLSYFEIARRLISAKSRLRKITKRTKIKATTKREQVLARIKQSGGFKPIRTAFAVRLGSGHIAILQRKTEARYPLRTLYGIGVPYMLQNPEVMREIERVAYDSFRKHYNFAISQKER